MAVRRVFIFWTNPIFHDAVRALLNHPEVEWAGASSDYARDVGQIATTHADTILVEEVEDFIPVDIMKFLENSQENLRVVGLNIRDNEIRIYHRVQRTIVRAEDLLKWILNNTF